MIFAEKKSGKDIEFPAICIFKRSDYLNDEKNNQAEYLINKVWLLLEDTEIISDVTNVMISPEYDKLKKDSRYVSDDYVIDHLNWGIKLDSSRLVLTSRLNSENKFILEFKRLSDIIAQVKYSYTCNFLKDNE